MKELLAEKTIELVNATVKEIMDEIILVARTSGIHTGTSLEDKAVEILQRTKPNDFKPSMLVDLEAGRPIEVEVILGEIVRKAAEFGVPVPRYEITLVYRLSYPRAHTLTLRLQILYASLQVIQSKLLAGREE